MKRYYSIIVLLILIACQKEVITIGTNVSEAFYLDNDGASMKVLVEGNTASQTFLLIVHGGPGSDSNIFNTNYISQHIEDKYAVVYWDQRNSGASQGNSNSNSLTLSNMTDDLKKVIQVLKSRYGQNSKVFLLGHSFGGLLTASFMTTGDNQSMVNGWIFLDGAHNYAMNDSLTRQMLLSCGQQQITLNKNTDQWTPIVSFCLAHTGNFSNEELTQLYSYAGTAETLFNEVKELSVIEMAENYTTNDFPVTSGMMNYLYTSNDDVNDELEKTQFTSVLYNVVKPTLILFGRYDFICPAELGVDVFNHINTTEKKMAISSVSGHDMFYQDESFFCDEVNDFIEKYR
jgi:pimeloyl-ACP methyl ester carboxylesterase